MQKFFRLFAPLLLLSLLAGCGSLDWEHLTSFGTSEPEAAAAPPPRAAQSAPRTASAAPAPAAPDPFCLGVARQDATTQGFDQATQGRVAIRSYQQCMGLFGPSAPK